MNEEEKERWFDLIMRDIQNRVALEELNHQQANDLINQLFYGDLHNAGIPGPFTEDSGRWD